MVKLINNNGNIAVTGWHGVTIKASAEQLAKVIGQPKAGDGNKTYREWDLTFGADDGVHPFTFAVSVYDWKEGYTPDSAVLEYHIGSKEPQTAIMAKEYILAELEKMKPVEKPEDDEIKVCINVPTEFEIHDAFREVTKQAIQNGALGKTVEDAGAGMTNVYMTILGYDQSILQCYPNGEYPYVYILIYKDGMEEHSIPIEALPEMMQRDIFEAYCRELTRKKV